MLAILNNLIELSYRKFTSRQVIQLTLLTALLGWSTALGTFYYLVVFAPSAGHHTTLIQATRFLLIHAMPSLLKMAVASILLSTVIWMSIALFWAWTANRLNRMAKRQKTVPDVTSNVWPPPPNLPEGQ